jgi:hypothetical protein
LLAFASLLWSGSGISDHAIATVVTLAQLLLFSLVVIDVINSRGSAEWLVKCLIVGGLFALLVTIQQGIVDPSIRRAGNNISGGINVSHSDALGICSAASVRIPPVASPWVGVHSACSFGGFSDSLSH